MDFFFFFATKDFSLCLYMPQVKYFDVMKSVSGESLKYLPEMLPGNFVCFFLLTGY